MLQKQKCGYVTQRCDSDLIQIKLLSSEKSKTAFKLSVTNFLLLPNRCESLVDAFCSDLQQNVVEPSLFCMFMVCF